MPHRDDLAAARARIAALEDRIDGLEAKKKEPEVPLYAPPPVVTPPLEGQAARIASRIARAKEMTANAERDASSTDMRAMIGAALASHPTSKEVLVTVVGGGAVGLLGMAANVLLFVTVDEARRHSGKAALFGSPAIVLATLIAVTLLSVALPRAFFPVPLGRTRSEDGTTYSAGLRLSRSVWASIAGGALLIDVLAFVLGSA